MFAACNGTGGLPGTGAGWTASTARRSSADPATAVRLRSAQREQAVLGHRARVRARRQNVPVAARRELRRASVHDRGPGAVKRQRAGWLLGLSPADRAIGRNNHPGAHVRQPLRAACFDYTTLGDEFDKAKLYVALLHEHVQQALERALVGLSGDQAYLRAGPTGRRTSSRRSVDSSATSKPVSSRALAGSRRSAPTPITRLRRRQRTVVGRAPSSMRSARASSGIRP